MAKQVTKTARNVVATKAGDVPASVQAGYAAGLSVEYAARHYRDAILAARPYADSGVKIKAINEGYKIGFMAALFAKKAFKAQPSAREMVCSMAAYTLAQEMFNKGKAAREAAGWQEIYKHAGVRLIQLQRTAGLNSEGADYVPTPKGARHETDAAESGASGYHSPAATDKEVAKEDLGKFFRAHKPQTFEQLESMALALGRAFGHWTRDKEVLPLLDGNERAKELGAAMRYFSKAMINLPKVDG